MSRTRKDDAGLLIDEESRTEELEESSRDFSHRSRLLKEKYEAEEKESFFPKNFFSRFTKNQQETKPVIALVENRHHHSPKPLPREIITTQQRIDLLEINLKKYKKTQPKIYSAGLKVVTEAYDLLETELSADDKLSLDRSLECATDLVKTPNTATLDAVCKEAKVALGHEHTFKKYAGALLSLVGLISAGILLFVVPPVSVLGFGMFLGGAYLYKQNQEKSMAKSLSVLADVNARYLCK